MRCDPGKDPRGNWASDGRAVFGREFLSNGIDGCELALRNAAHDFINFDRRGITHVPSPQRLESLPSIVNTLGRSFESASFSRQDFRLAAIQR